MAYSAVDIAKYVVSYCEKRCQPVTNLKLQKMLYYLWIDYYKRTTSALFFDDICAWQLGPVVPEAYYTFCSYAGAPICKTFDVHLLIDDTLIINEIIEKYLPIPASSLVTRSHCSGGAWKRVYQEGQGNRDVIPFSLIRDLECGNLC